MSKRVFKGVHYRKDRDRWVGRIVIDGKTIGSPHFLTEAEAQEWYDNMSYDHYGFDRTHEPELPAPTTSNISNAPTIDPRLVEIFEYNLGVDLTEPKHQAFLYELADYFKSVSEKAIREFYSAQMVLEPASPKLKDLNQGGEV